MQDRFEDKFIPEPNSGCWLWTASVNQDGYGNFGIGSRADKTQFSAKAHRIAHELYVGPIPAGLSVLHRCDIPSCVNPNHLFLGTQADNVHDMEKKGRGRHLRGAAHGRVKLSESDVRYIRNSDKRNVDLARMFNVTKTHIGYIKNRKAWSWL